MPLTLARPLSLVGAEPLRHYFCTLLPPQARQGAAGRTLVLLGAAALILGAIITQPPPFGPR